MWTNTEPIPGQAGSMDLLTRRIALWKMIREPHLEDPPHSTHRDKTASPKFHGRGAMRISFQLII
jgi:hypothetical protein